MKDSTKKACEKLRNEKGFYENIRNPWSKASAQTLNLARASEEGKVPKHLAEELGEKLGENQERILVLISKNKFITIPELSKGSKISTTAVENNLAKLKKKGLLKRIGPAKGGHWEVVIKE